ncbi:unnamed protein product [Schistosoma curassoni]|uniref:Uncharacterized protein n=1 Tax=Schistosoma curassoni TaxID=6186 RepID=A0A183KK03_9TREM|nr:unnamed protein product [Schistosoma curassoni]
MVNAAKRCFSKSGRDTSDSTRSVDTQIDEKETRVSLETADSHRPKEERQSSKRYVLIKNSRKEVSSVPLPLNGIQQKTPRNRNRKARSVSNGKRNLTSQVIDSPLEFHNMFDATVVATPTIIDEWLQVISMKRHNDT